MIRLGSWWENFAEEEAAEILARAGKVDSKIAPAETSMPEKLSCECCTGRLRLRFQGFPPVEWSLSIEKLLKIKMTATHLLRWFNAYVQVALLVEQFEDVIKMKWPTFHGVNWRVNVSCSSLRRIWQIYRIHWIWSSTFWRMYHERFYQVVSQQVLRNMNDEISEKMPCACYWDLCSESSRNVLRLAGGVNFYSAYDIRASNALHVFIDFSAIELHACHDCVYIRPPHASTLLTCFNVPRMLRRSSHASHVQSRVFTIFTVFTSERGLDLSHANLVRVNNTRVNMLLLVMFVYFSINSIAASHISLAFNSVVLGYIS